MSAPSARPAGEVDLNAMDSSPSFSRSRPTGGGGGTAPSGTSAAGGKGVHANFGSMAQPIFKIYFDFLAHSRPGYTQPTFDNYHSIVLVEIVPTPDIQFAFDLNPAPKFYELDYKLSESLTLRLGKIWLPFDDLAPHNIYGGKMNTSKLATDSTSPFLPDIWADLGVGLRLQAIDTAALAAKFDLYVVNGFRGSATDPKTGVANSYPSFGEPVTGPDNNQDKSIGARGHLLFGRTLGAGLSLFSGRWSDQTAESKRMTLIGLDASLRFAKTEIRAGLTTMMVDVVGDRMMRAGAYAELGQKLDSRERWKFLFRGGILQMDDRIVDRNDQRIIGGTLCFRPNLLELQLGHHRDLQKTPGKQGYNYTDLRVVMAF